VLWQLGVNYIQGDYLQKPMPAMSYDFADLT
jgi:EAL domain-containing protein (putative c-di-GMP-specific phosphodiesterase class I)